MSQTGYAHRSLSWKYCLVGLMLLAVGVMSRDLRSADDKKADDDVDTPAVEINAIGEPSTDRQTPDAPTIYVWRTGETWHVQTKSKNLFNVAQDKNHKPSQKHCEQKIREERFTELLHVQSCNPRDVFAVKTSFPISSVHR